MVFSSYFCFLIGTNDLKQSCYQHTDTEKQRQEEVLIIFFKGFLCWIIHAGIGTLLIEVTAIILELQELQGC